MAGDFWTWYNPDGTARLWTFQTGDVLKINTNGEVDLTGPIRFADGSLQTKLKPSVLRDHRGYKVHQDRRDHKDLQDRVVQALSALQ
ncbi:MAG TPA: hypothetical protein VI636_19020 [Candidatus Angelobacter sp.]